MDQSSFDRALTASGRTAFQNAPAVREDLTALAQQARRHSTRRRSPRLVPVVAVAGLAVTGAAAAWVTSVQPDVVIPVEYTTDTGRAVECVIYFEVPDTAIRDHLNQTQWDGVGQRIYDRARAMTLNSPDRGAFDTESERDSWYWFTAARELTEGTIPVTLLPENDVVAASDSSCTGDLH